MLGRALTSVFWGMVADRYGRKVVIIFGTFSVYVTTRYFARIFFLATCDMLLQQFLIFFMCRVVLNTLFGLSINLWMAIATRFLLGSLNGLLGPIKVPPLI